MKGACVLACGLVISGVGGGVRAETPRNAITFEPLAVAFARTIAAEYEHGWGSVGLHLGCALTLGGFDADTQVGDYLALGATLGVRVYPSSEAPTGLFIDPFGSLAWVRATSGSQSAAGVGWSAGAMVGWTWVFGSVFALSLGGGGAWYALEVTTKGLDTASTAGRSGLWPVIRVGVGAAF